MPAGLRAMRRALAASACSVWLPDGGGMRRAWSAGRDGFTGDAALRASRARRAPSGDPGAIPLRSGRRVVGVLVVRFGRPPGAHARALVDGVAGLLVPILVQRERLRQLEETVAAGTREIEEQRAFFERIVDTLPVGLYVIDRDFRVRAWNRKREGGLQGVARSEVLGQTIFDVLHRQPADVLRREFEELFAKGETQQFQTESVASGEPRVYRLTKIPMRDGAGEITHAITIGEDMTEWKKAEARVAQAEKLAALGTLAAGVMHEINNPLATIAAAAESLGLRVDEGGLAGDALVAELRAALQLIAHEVSRCSGIVAGVLDFSRPRPLRREPVPVNALVQRTLFLLKHHARFKTLRVVTRLDEGAPNVVGNDEQLIQVLMALLLNAMDAMDGGPDGGEIRVRTGPAGGGQVLVEVADDGVGIRRDVLPRIFEPFFTTKPVGRGTGLGLSVCYSIVSDHGGRIEVNSTFGRGSSFRVLLPAEVPR
ncbi:MAG TPA: ATP-binding protein [Gemmatimonadaceae bacterium]